MFVMNINERRRRRAAQAQAPARCGLVTDSQVSGSRFGSVPESFLCRFLFETASAASPPAACDEKCIVSTATRRQVMADTTDRPTAAAAAASVAVAVADVNVSHIQPGPAACDWTMGTGV